MTQQDKIVKLLDKYHIVIKASDEFPIDRAVPSGLVAEEIAAVQNEWISELSQIKDSTKAKCMSEFSWLEDIAYHNEDCVYTEASIKHIVPWALCKEIYIAMLNAQLPQPPER